MNTQKRKGEAVVGFIVALLLGLVIFGVAVFIFTYFFNPPTTLPSTYQGIVQIIHNGENGYIQFNDGLAFYGNISKIANLSIGADCTLIQSPNDPAKFSSGVCK